ncbi:MAG: cupin domain-containing protein [Candidatus Helarchaeota archaeon]
MMEKKNEKDIPWRNQDSGPKYIFRGPNIDWGLILYKPGQQLGKHYHEETEETFYILEGTPTFVVDDEEFQMDPGDALRIEKKHSHDIINKSTKDCKILFIKYPYLPKDKVNV